ncbi:MAG: helix-turn-helix domain-containing protein, partial [Isosphaeraceae bacterium]|nr:helix-turn-helix domain-containing protein [Isosphaeraceae bacterium]
MAQFYTLEEAARVLGMSPDELKQKAQQREVRAFLDSGSWRFRVADIDELARRRGMGSDPDLSLSDLDLEIPSDSGSEELLLSEFQIGAANPELKAQSVETAKPPTGGEEILLDDMTVPPHPVTGSSSVIIGMEGTGKLPSDSDVKLVPEISRGASDSDVRLASPPPLKASDSDVKLVGQGRPSDSDIKLAPLGELPKVSGEQPKSSDSDVTLVSDDSSSSFEVARPSADAGQRSGSGETMIARSPLLGSSGEVPATAPEEDSDFELTPSSVIDALQPESGSDFELTALDSSSDDFESSPLLAPSESDVTGAQPSASGINLGRPSDSGINLQQVGSLNLDSESIELAPLEEDEPPAQKAPPKPAAKPAPKPAAAEKKKVDLSATALPIKGEKDIFEDTDFEVDALDSGE